MINRKKCALLTLAGLTTMALGTIARADQTAPQVKSTEALGTALSTTDWAKTLTFDKFDPTLGALTGVCIELDNNILTFGSFTNNAQSSATFKYVTTVDTEATIAGLSLDAPATTTVGPLTLAAGASASFGPTNSSATTGLVNYNAAAVLAAFTGPGTINLSGDTLTSQSLVGGGGNVSATQSTFAQMTGTVFYKYQPNTSVPEPGSVALLTAGGLSGAGFLVRRRRK